VAFAEGSWQVCNHTGDNLTIGIAYVNPGSGGGFISEGWWTINRCHGCATVLLRHETSDPRNVFLFAEDKNGTSWVSGDSRMCNISAKHKIVGNGNCGKRGLKEGHYKHTLVDLDKQWTTNIDGKGCID
jgi:uncharacterized membrane protein